VDGNCSGSLHWGLVWSRLDLDRGYVSFIVEKETIKKKAKKKKEMERKEGRKEKYTEILQILNIFLIFDF